MEKPTKKQWVIFILALLAGAIQYIIKELYFK